MKVLLILFGLKDCKQDAWQGYGGEKTQSFDFDFWPAKVEVYWSYILIAPLYFN